MKKMRPDMKGMGIANTRISIQKTVLTGKACVRHLYTGPPIVITHAMRSMNVRTCDHRGKNDAGME